MIEFMRHQERSRVEPTAITRAELIQGLTRVLEVPVQLAVDILDAMLSGMVRALQCGERIEIRGFGTFATRERGARTARNPKTGARVDVPPKRIPYFKPGKELGDLLNTDTSMPHSNSESEIVQRRP